MDIRKAFNKSRKNSAVPIDFGYVFVDTEDSVKYDEHLRSFDHFDLYSNFYFPFNRVTHYRSDCGKNEDGMSTAVTFIDNLEHKITSPINFIAMLDDVGVLEGSLEIKLMDEGVQDYMMIHQLRNPDRCVVGAELRISEADEKSKFMLVLSLKTFHMHDRDRGVKRTITMTKSHAQQNLFKAIIHQFVSQIAHGLTYFTRMIIDTKLFVIEERVARIKKGVMRLNDDKIPLFRTIDIKTLRAKYIKRESDADGNVIRVGHERRRHTRTFRSDFYKNKKGDTIVIEATWVGPTEHFDGPFNRFYKVRLDIG